MQLICEAYQLMKDCLGMDDAQMHDVFSAWNKTELDSYLIEITADILAFKDEDGAPIVEKILDAAGQKGTGKWTAIAALDEGRAADADWRGSILPLSLGHPRRARGGLQGAFGPPAGLHGRPRGLRGSHPTRRCTPRKSSPTRRGTS